MENKYFTESEKEDFEIFKKLNADIGMLHEFNTMPTKHCMDVSGKTDLTKVMIELKNRTGNITSFEDVYIESKKAAYLYMMWVLDNFIPLYINYFRNGKEEEYPEIIAIWRLDKLSTFKYHPTTKTTSKGYGKDEYRERFGLLPVDAVMYKLIDGKYKKIKNIGEHYNN